MNKELQTACMLEITIVEKALLHTIRDLPNPIMSQSKFTLNKESTGCFQIPPLQKHYLQSNIMILSNWVILKVTEYIKQKLSKPCNEELNKPESCNLKIN